MHGGSRSAVFHVAVFIVPVCLFSKRYVRVACPGVGEFEANFTLNGDLFSQVHTWRMSHFFAVVPSRTHLCVDPVSAW